MVIDIGNESKSQRVCVSVCICFPKIVNLNKTLSDFPIRGGKTKRVNMWSA